MTPRILIAPDKFKGTLTAMAAAQAIARGWRRARPADRLELLPISDGGDGFGETLSVLLEARARTVKTLDAAHRPIRAEWWWDPRRRLAIIESARIIGLARLPAGRHHPFALDSYGLGAALLAAAQLGARRCILGLGGSATNDGGFGVARALGWQFLDDRGRSIEAWPQLDRLARLLPPRRRRLFPELIVAVDVQNRLLGARGCSRVYGPQKGLRPEDFPAAEAALCRLAAVAKRAGLPDAARQPGAGAAGGLGFGLVTFAGARLAPGFELFARQAGLRRRLRRASLVITGEGAIDNSTLMGKGVGELATWCRNLKVPCVGLGGVVVHSEKMRRLFMRLAGLLEITSPENARGEAARWLAELAAQTARQFGCRDHLLV